MPERPAAVTVSVVVLWIFAALAAFGIVIGTVGAGIGGIVGAVTGLGPLAGAIGAFSLLLALPFLAVCGFNAWLAVATFNARPHPPAVRGLDWERDLPRGRGVENASSIFAAFVPRAAVQSRRGWLAISCQSRYGAASLSGS